MIDLANKRFGKLTALKYVGNSKWLCKCDCGNETRVNAYKLTSGHTKSCGCLKHNGYHYTHKLGKPKTYSHWVNMKTRCYNKNSVKYKTYGERGITVCDEWLDFKNFHEWAITHGYEDGLTIDRIDNDKGYCPENCRWVTRLQQAKNKRNNHMITYNGITDTIEGWNTRLGYYPDCIRRRIVDRGWDVIRALTTKPRTMIKPVEKLITFNGETHNITAWSKILKINKATLSDRLKRGWSIERALTTK